MTTSSKKVPAHASWKEGLSFEEIGKRLGVATATAQVYVIDTIVLYDGGDLGECQKLLEDMCVGKNDFSKVANLFSGNGAVTLREIKDSTF